MVLSPEKSTANVRQRIKPFINHEAQLFCFYSLFSIRCTPSFNLIAVTLRLRG